MRLLPAIFALLIASSAYAKGDINATPYREGVTPALAVSDSDLSDAATFNLDGPNLASYSEIIFWVVYDHDSTAGTITFTCTYSYDKGTTDFTPYISDGAAAATLTSSGTFATASLSADTNYTFRMGLYGYSSVECSVAHSGGDTGSITVRYTLVSP